MNSHPAEVESYNYKGGQIAIIFYIPDSKNGGLCDCAHIMTIPEAKEIVGNLTTAIREMEASSQ